MSAANLSCSNRDPRLLSLGVLAAALAIAAVSARPYAGAWNDGSRLATVECLVDYHTLAIDRSIYVQVPPLGDTAPPYAADEPLLLEHGTADKLLIDGHFYSDKSPVPALLLACLYQTLQVLTGLTAHDRPDLFCYALTLGSSGLAYVVAVWCLFRLGRPLRLSLPLRLLLTASFALSTVALPYARHVNNHILLLGVVAAMTCLVAWLAEGTTWPRIAGLGSLAGLGYSIDLGAGPVLLMCTLALVAWRSRRLVTIALFLTAALPWLALHHAVNYAVGGTFKPANAVAEYFEWPGCPFNPTNMTGTWNHSLGHFFIYAAALLVGKRGFFDHSLPLFLVLPGLMTLLRRG